MLYRSNIELQKIIKSLHLQVKAELLLDNFLPPTVPVNAHQFFAKIDTK